MKVLIITASLNERSGWGRYSRAVIDQLIARGMDVVVCTETVADVPYPTLQISPLSSIGAFLKNLFTVRRATRDATLIHALDGWPYGVYGWFAVMGTRKSLFINGVGTYSVAPLYSPFRGFLLRRAYARAQKIFCISNYTKQQLAEAGISEAKLLTILQGTLRLPELSPAEVTEYRTKYNLAEDRRPIILTVGAIKDRKGQIDTLKAVEILKGTHPHILYVVVGSAGSRYAENLSAYAAEHDLQDNLLVVSDADDRALAFFYSICDIFALNSNTDNTHHHFEGFGLVIVEAYQFGAPAVGSSGCGIEDAIDDGKTGFLTAQRDSQDIAQRMAQLLERRDVFSANAKRKYGQFDWADTVARYVEWYPKR
jgi:glycosyltransferase involved in cell wall biosynthesis